MSNIPPFNPAYRAVLGLDDLKAIVALLESHPDQGAATGVLSMISNRCGEGHDDAMRERISKYQEGAQSSAKDGAIEVDPDACVSMGADPGAYVQVWAWVSNQAAGIEETEEALEVQPGEAEPLRR
jgi:hypothetical protein